MAAKLDKETLDKVREIDGFPIGKDEDIINLSDPPYYTACPNPELGDFIKKHGKEYDFNNDDYHREPFASDISSGKNDPIYNAHSYVTKIPPKAIVPLILHYTEPGDIIFDGFCGTGMTGVATQMCKVKSEDFNDITKNNNSKIKWGSRKCILVDLSILATFISYNTNYSQDAKSFEHDSNKIIKEIKETYDYFYQTHNEKVNYFIWSFVYSCPNCNSEIPYWDKSIEEIFNDDEKNYCKSCKLKYEIKDLEKIWITKKNFLDDSIIKEIKKIPVLINYEIQTKNKKRHFKKFDKDDLKLINQIDNLKIPYWVPNNELPQGDKTNEVINKGIRQIFQFYTKRNLIVLSFLHEKVKHSNFLKFWFTSALPKLTMMNRFMPEYKSRALVGPMPNALYAPPLFVENDVPSQIKFQQKKLMQLELPREGIIVSTQSSVCCPQIHSNSIDYIFTDPPFGSNLMYSELNLILESWLKIKTNNTTESIINKSQKKGLVEYQELMERSFKENYRILKPGRWMTIVFHNSQNKVWMAIQEAIQRAGFVVADVRILDKKRGTTNQLSFTSGAVDKDLVISTYKPSGGLDEYFGGLSTGTEEGVWKFLDSHLKQLPIFVEKNDMVETINERQKFLLFDRMIAFHIQKGLTVPISASEFYEKLNQKYSERDGMYFLAEQIPEYDQKRVQVKSIKQTTIFVEDEKSTIIWLNEQLKTPQTSQDIQPKFLQEIHKNKFEKLPELSEILEQNFLEDENNKWHIPDPSKLKDLEKLREKSLLREFQTYQESKGKLKQFRLEAIRAGFKKKWSESNYKSIVDIANRLPEQIIQEDSSLLMYYDNASSRL